MEERQCSCTHMHIADPCSCKEPRYAPVKRCASSTVCFCTPFYHVCIIMSSCVHLILVPIVSPYIIHVSLINRPLKLLYNTAFVAPIPAVEHCSVNLCLTFCDIVVSLYVYTCLVCFLICRFAPTCGPTQLCTCYNSGTAKSH